MKNPVIWFELYVDDIERATTFYESVLATTLSKMDDPSEQDMKMMRFSGDMETHGASGMLVQMEGMKAGGE
jgi:uncharacterized protein